MVSLPVELGTIVTQNLCIGNQAAPSYRVQTVVLRNLPLDRSCQRKSVAWIDTGMDAHIEIIDLLRQFATRHDPDRLDDAVASLAPHDESVVAALAESLSDEDAEVRLLSVEILRELGSKAEPALPAMIRVLEDEDRIVRIASLEPVAAFGERAKAAIPILEKWLTTDDEFSRVSAAGHILMIEPSKSDKMMPVLYQALASNNTVIQRQAEWLLDELGMSTRSAASEQN
jgi:HEAT repeat protein